MTAPILTEAQFLAQQGGYLALHGPKLIQQGYTPVPIQAGKKSPGYEGWQKSKASNTQIKTWIENGHKWSGVGILTKNAPAIDVDVRDAEVAQLVEDWIIQNIGTAPKRIGRAPKRLFLFRTDEPFRKMRTNKYMDEWAQEHQIEFLADGQQFVAYHKHPDTQKPYTWPDEMNPLNTRISDLITLTIPQIEALIEYFHGLAAEREWVVVKKSRGSATAVNEDNPWAEDTSSIIISDDELRDRLMLVPHAEDYEQWYQIGMALYHQYDGEDIGLEMWHEWAESADNYDASILDEKWKTFDIGGKKRAPLTARFILKLAQEAAETKTAELTMELRDLFMSAKDLAGWEVAKKAAREAEIDSLSRTSLANIAKSTRDQITGTKVPLIEIKKAIAFVPKNAGETPAWAEPWVYDTSEDRFFSTKTKVSTTKQGFDAMYDRKALSKADILNGRKEASHTASSLALNQYQIPIVVGRRYVPGQDSIFTEPDGVFANTYPEHEIPETPTTLTPRDKRNVERVKNHIRHLLVDKKERRIFVDWLSWVVQNPGKHARFAILLQGVQGDGKTFFAEMMRAVMGVSNVTMLNAHILQSDFTDWAEGQCLACIEEVRLINDKNKYEILNRVKPYITNTINEIHPKGKAVRNVLNTTSYLMFTNYRDALPIDDTDRRYLVLFSQWSARAPLLAFKQAHPDYFVELYHTLEDSVGAIRKWLLEWRQEETFDPMGDAPDTAARQTMIQRSKPAFIKTLDEIIHGNEVAGVSADLVSVAALKEAMFSRDTDIPAERSMIGMLERDGYEQLGRIRTDDGQAFFWSKHPERFSYGTANNLITDGNLVRKYLRKREEDVSDF